MHAFCERVGLAYSGELVRPYSNIEQKMVDGVHPGSIPMGDTRMLERKQIDATVANSWKETVVVNFLSEPTWQLAERLGYERHTPGSDDTRKANSRTQRLQGARSRRKRRQTIRRL